MMPIAILVLAVYAIMSVVTLAAYGIDKRQATLGRRRIRERTLHTLEFCCGWPGAVVGRTVFKHKRRKVGFSFVTALLIILNLGILIGIVVLRRQ